MPASVLEATSTVATSTPESDPANNQDVDNQAGGEATTPLFSDPGVDVNPIPSGAVGSTVTTTVTLSNSGSATVTFTPVVVVNGVSTTLTAVTLAPGQSTNSAPISVPLTTTGATVTALVGTSTVPDSNLSNNSDTEGGTGLFADPGVDVRPIPSGAPGSTVTTTVTLSNNGSTTVTFTPVVVVNGVSTTLTAVTLAPGQTVSSAPITVPLTATGATVTALVGTSSVADRNPANNIDVEHIAPAVPTATVSGRAFYDVNRNGSFDTSEPVLVGYVAELLQFRATNTIVVGSATTGADGRYVIDGQYPGTNYQIRFRDPRGTAILGTPYNQATTTAQGNASTGVTVSDSGATTGTSSGVIQSITLYEGDNTVDQNLPLDPSGVVYDSVTRQPIAGAVVRLVGPSGFNARDHLVGGDGADVVTTVANGLYQFFFNGAPSGQYTLQITAPAGYSSAPAVLGGVALPQGTLDVGPGKVLIQALDQPPAPALTGLPATLYYTSFRFDFSTGRNSEVHNNHIPLDPLRADPAVDVNPIPSGGVGTTVTTTVTLSNNGSITVSFTPVVVVNGVGTTLTTVMLAPGQSTASAPITVPLTITGATVTASVTNPSVLDSNLANNTDTEGGVGLLADPGVDVQPIPGGAPGSTVTTTVTLSNNGSATVTFTPVVVVNGATTTLAAATLAPGQTVSSAPVSVPLTTAGATVTAFVTNASVADSNPANNSDTEVVSSTQVVLLVNKVGDKSVAEVGDSIKYTIRVTNTSAVEALNVSVKDWLPAGFRLIPGTVRGSATVADDTARPLVFQIDRVPANNGVAEFSYYVRLGAGSQQGDGINRAQAVSGVSVSNTAAFKVTVRGGVFSNEGCIVGKVYSDCDGNHVQNNAGGSRELGIPGVRLVMLDGSYVVTDADGKYSVCGVKPQTHVIKVDRKTLPLGARLLPSSNRNAGDGNSIFVDMKGGEMARADFVEGSCSPQVLDQVKARRAQGGDASPETEQGPVHRIQPGGESPLQQIMPAAPQNGANATGGAAQ
jgi:uncharacterized repeat protein (TIGR01451 family)